MEKFIVKVEKFDWDKPYFREAIRKDLSCQILSVLENLPNTTETFEEKEYRIKELRLHLGKFVGLYVDDKSFKIIEDLMSLSNEQIDIICRKRYEETKEKFREELYFNKKTEKQIEDKVKKEIKQLSWVKRLKNSF